MSASCYTDWFSPILKHKIDFFQDIDPIFVSKSEEFSFPSKIRNVENILYV